VLASHTGSTIYALRRLVVERGALGTTAATHLIAAPIVKHVVPGTIRLLAIAESLTTVQQEGAGYARIVGSGDKNFNSSNARLAAGVGLNDLREQVYATFGRKARTRAV
jgi:hypothetical protein